MLRNLFTLLPAVAMALPLVAAQSSMARPLANDVAPAAWGDKFDDDDDDQSGDLELLMCTQTIIEIGGDSRAYTCGVESGPACLARCTPEVVAANCDAELALGLRSYDPTSCEDRQIAACRSECEAGGATFCGPELAARWGKFDDDDDDDHGGDDSLVFINTETCLELNVGGDGR